MNKHCPFCGEGYGDRDDADYAIQVQEALDCLSAAVAAEGDARRTPTQADIDRCEELAREHGWP